MFVTSSIRNFIKYIIISAVISFSFFSSAAPSDSYNPEVRKENYKRKQNPQQEYIYSSLINEASYVLIKINAAIIDAQEQKQIIELFLNKKINKEEAAQQILGYLSKEEKKLTQQSLKNISSNAVQYLDDLSIEDEKTILLLSGLNIEKLTQWHFLKTASEFLEIKERIEQGGMCKVEPEEYII